MASEELAETSSTLRDAAAGLANGSKAEPPANGASGAEAEDRANGAAEAEDRAKGEDQVKEGP